MGFKIFDFHASDLYGRGYPQGVVTKTRNHPKPPKTTQNHPKLPKTTQNHQQNDPKPPKTTYKTNKTNQNDPKPATIYPNTTSLRDICVDGRR